MNKKKNLIITTKELIYNIDSVPLFGCSVIAMNGAAGAMTKQSACYEAEPINNFTDR